MPLGWRPADVVATYPVYKISDVYHFEKYDPETSPALKTWSWIQLISLLLFISYLFGNIAKIASPDIYVYGLFIFLSVYSLTDLLDKNFYAFAWEGIRSGLGVYLLITQKDWFGLSAFVPNVVVWLATYFCISLAFAFYFSWLTKKQKLAHVTYP